MAYKENWENWIYKKKYFILAFLMLFFLCGLIFTDLSFREVYLGCRQNHVLSVVSNERIYKYWFFGYKGIAPRYLTLARFVQKKDVLLLFMSKREFILTLPTPQNVKSFLHLGKK